MFTTEPAKEGDADALAQLRVLAMKPSLSQIGRFDPERARGRFLDSFVAADTVKLLLNEELVGFYCVTSDARALTLSHLYIHPGFQGRGMGAQVVARLKAMAIQQRLPLRLGAQRPRRIIQRFLGYGFALTHEQQWDVYYQFN